MATIVRRFLVTVGLSLVALGATSGSPLAAQQPGGQTIVDPGSGISQELADSVTNSVGQVELAFWTGTGWLATPEVVITNFHVSKAGNGMLRFTPSGGESVRCWVAAADRAADLAALRCPTSDRTPLPIATRPSVLGEPVVVVGYPGGNGPKVTTGRVTELGREVWRTDSLGFDAAIEPGSSGSPVVAADGTVLAVATFSGGESGGYGSKAAKIREVIRRGQEASPSWGGAVGRLFIERILAGAAVIGGLAGFTGWRSGTGRGKVRLVAGAIAGAFAGAAFTGLQILIDGPTNMIT